LKAIWDEKIMGKRKHLQEVDNRITLQDPEDFCSAIFVLPDQLNLSYLIRAFLEWRDRHALSLGGSSAGD